jgi:hypothetical protein
MNWVFRIGLLIPAVAITLVALPHLNAGLRLERAFPASAYIQTNTPLPIASYREVAGLLATAPDRDAESALLQAEAAIDAGQPLHPIMIKVEDVLSVSPFSSRGWIIFASLMTDQDPRNAAKALTLAYELAPRDYYLTFPRTLVAAPLWSYLPVRIRASLLGDVSALAGNPEKHAQLRVLLSKPGGADLVVRSFAGKPEALRELNRALARETLHL